MFVGSPKNIVEIEKPVEVQNTSSTTVNSPVITVAENKKENINRETVIAEANITKIFENKKEEKKYPEEVVKKSLGLEIKLK